MKVKIIEAGDIVDLELLVNEFLSEKSNEHIIDIKYGGCVKGVYGYYYSAMIIMR